MTVRLEPLALRVLTFVSRALIRCGSRIPPELEFLKTRRSNITPMTHARRTGLHPGMLMFCVFGLSMLRCRPCRGAPIIHRKHRPLAVSMNLQYAYEMHAATTKLKRLEMSPTHDAWMNACCWPCSTLRAHHIAGNCPPIAR